MIYNGSSWTGGGTRYMLNDGSGSFIFDLENRIDTPPQGIRNIYASDLNDDGNKEIIVFNSSGFGANGANGLPNIIKIYIYDHNLNFLMFHRNILMIRIMKWIFIPIQFG